MKHGLYSKVLKGTLAAPYEALLDEPRLTDIREQIALQHGLLMALIERSNEEGAPYDHEALLRVSNSISASILRLARIEYAKHNLIPRQKLDEVISVIVETIREFVPEDRWRELSERLNARIRLLYGLDGAPPVPCVPGDERRET